MAWHSEIIICSFDTGIELVSESQIISHLQEKGRPHPNPGPIDLVSRDPPPSHTSPELPPGWRGTQSSRISIGFEALNSGMWHNRSPGETRVKIDYSRVISFFDPILSSLTEARIGKSRDEFRLDAISETDSGYIQEQLEDVFTRGGQGSGIDWGSITQVIVDRYGKRLELLRYILQNPESKWDVTEQVAGVRSQTLIMLTPYMLVSAIPPNPTGPVDPSWVSPVVDHCASTHTAWAPRSLLTPQENTIKAAVEEVLSRICGVLGGIWVDAFDSEKAGVRDLERILEKWRSDVTQLMAWLDWPIWLKCEPACAPEVWFRLVLLTSRLNLKPFAQELCYIPTWPWGYRFRRDGEERVDMKPRCIEAVAPYSFLQSHNPVPP